MSDPRKQKADLLYGASGSRKTSNIGKAAEWMYNRTGKITRLITADGGGYDVLEAYVDAGVIKPLVILGWPHLLSNFDLLCQGYWPKNGVDTSKGFLKPSEQDWSNIGITAIEGLTSGGDQLMRYMTQNKLKVSQDPSYVYTDGDPVSTPGGTGVQSYAGSSPAYYGEIQNRLHDVVHKSHMIPCTKVIWTALEGRGEEEGTRIPIFGPAIVGKKSTGKATQWFGNSLHFEVMAKEDKKNELTGQIDVVAVHIMYTRTHVDPLTKMPFPCKHRAVLQYADEVQPFYIPPDLGKFYQLLQDLRDRAAAELKKAMVAVPAAMPIEVEVPTVPTVSTVPTAAVVPVAPPVPVAVTAAPTAAPVVSVVPAVSVVSVKK